MMVIMMMMMMISTSGDTRCSQSLSRKEKLDLDHRRSANSVPVRQRVSRFWESTHGEDLMILPVPGSYRPQTNSNLT